MPNSNFVFKQGESIFIGSHGETDYLFHQGEPVANSGPDGFVFESGFSLSNVGFFDGWEDGNYTSDPSWDEYLVEGDGSASVVSRSSPDGGSNCLRIHETTDGGTEYVIGWSNGMSGWNNTWTTRGLFYTANVNLSASFQTHNVHLYSSDSNNVGINVNLGFRDGNGNNVPFRITGNLIDSVNSTDGMSGWSQNTWYRYEIQHNGAGGYDGYCWVDGNGKPDSPNATSTGSAPGTEFRYGALVINGAEDTAFDIDHAFMEWG